MVSKWRKWRPHNRGYKQNKESIPGRKRRIGKELSETNITIYKPIFEKGISKSIESIYVIYSIGFTKDNNRTWALGQHQLI